MSTQQHPRFPSYEFSLPPWVEDCLPGPGHTFATVEERMDLVIRLAHINCERQTGGPFGAAIFNLESSTLVAPGVNTVIPSRCSLAHAEMVALALAQQVSRNHDLGGPGMPRMQLVTSTEPCAMCLGAVPWSGVRSLVCGAREEDARDAGFDEGDKPAHWTSALEARGIDVLRDVKRKEANNVLRAYLGSGGDLYNGGGGSGRAVGRTVPPGCGSG
jgi:tRNA(Arg) A34 adenosine deaminase TadA